MKHIHTSIQNTGGRLTRIKKAILAILSNHCCLLTKTQLLNYLQKKNIYPNRSTIYRELQSLTKHSIILKNTIQGVDYYELPNSHHHHLICLKCNSIKKVEFGNHLSKQEQQLAKQNNFTIISHSLEFYGYCFTCQRAGINTKHNL